MVRKRKSMSSVIDFSNVESRGLVSEGEHRIKVDEVTEEQGKEFPYWKWVFKVDTGGKLFHNTSLAPQSLWSLRALLENLGVEVPEEASGYDFDELVDLEIICDVVHEKYEGKTYAKVAEFRPIGEEAEEVEEEEEEEVKPAPKKGKASKKKLSITQDEINTMDRDELEDVIKTFNLECDLSKTKHLRKAQQLVIDAAQDAEVLID
jgi:hypothetical protein